MSDVFHTFFGVCGLSLMKHFDAITAEGMEKEQWGQ
jgi:prenyltransferase beta subunit